MLPYIEIRIGRWWFYNYPTVSLLKLVKVSFGSYNLHRWKEVF
jgi:hypothetical protein